MEVWCGRQDVDVITANPKTAGVARWNFFALWGHRLDKGEAAALDYTTKVPPPHIMHCLAYADTLAAVRHRASRLKLRMPSWNAMQCSALLGDAIELQHACAAVRWEVEQEALPQSWWSSGHQGLECVSLRKGCMDRPEGWMTWVVMHGQVFERVLVQPRDAREASDVFYKQNTGDVLLNYENEVIFTNLQYGEADAMPYVVPNNNVRVSAALLPDLLRSCTLTSLSRLPSLGSSTWQQMLDCCATLVA